MRFGLFHLLRFPEPWSAEKKQKCLWECIEQYTMLKRWASRPCG